MIPHIFGILNMTTDSFSDGGLYLEPATAERHAVSLVEQGASTVDIGAVSSNPAGMDVSIDEEVQRLEHIVPALLSRGYSVSVDSFRTPVQRHFLHCGIHYINDISGFSDRAFYPELADCEVRIVIMHSIRHGRAIIDEMDPDAIPDRLIQFFDDRLNSMEKAGISRKRMILDPGMGHFLGRNADCSVQAIGFIPDLKKRYECPILVGVSRKSFLGSITDRDVSERQSASLVAELVCMERGADFIRTHDPASLIDGCRVLNRLSGTV